VSCSNPDCPEMELQDSPAEYAGDVRFCPVCGAQLVAGAPQTPPTPEVRRDIKRALLRELAWNLTTVVVPLLGFAFALLWLLDRLHRSVYPAEAFWTAVGVAPTVSGLAALLACFLPAFLFGNFLQWLLRGTRQVAGKEALRFSETEYNSIQAQFLRASLVAVPILLGIAIAAALRPWG